MVGEMVQNSQSLYSFTSNAVIVIHEYIYSHSTTNFTLKKYIYSHLMMYFLFTNIFTHIYEIYSFTFNGLYSFTFTIEIFIQHFCPFCPIDESSVLIVQDWAMKYLTRKYRESQADWFDKRGIPWHLTIATRQEGRELQMLLS